jgi:hypothetical protein
MGLDMYVLTAQKALITLQKSILRSAIICSKSFTTKRKAAKTAISTSLRLLSIAPISTPWRWRSKPVTCPAQEDFSSVRRMVPSGMTISNLSVRDVKRCKVD